MLCYLCEQEIKGRFEKVNEEPICEICLVSIKEVAVDLKKIVNELQDELSDCETRIADLEDEIEDLKNKLDY